MNDLLIVIGLVVAAYVAGWLSGRDARGRANFVAVGWWRWQVAVQEWQEQAPPEPGYEVACPRCGEPNSFDVPTWFASFALDGSFSCDGCGADVPDAEWHRLAERAVFALAGVRTPRMLRAGEVVA